MKTHDNGSFFTVSFNQDDASAFAAQWPCSTVRGSGSFQFQKSNGDLVDATGAAAHNDGPDWLAFSQDCQAFGERSLAPLFKLEINLDDPEECEAFIEAHGTTDGRRLANKLGLKGPKSTRLATALSCYAWNKKTAMSLRLEGKIAAALSYEGICDHIYSRDIQPLCECW